MLLDELEAEGGALQLETGINAVEKPDEWFSVATSKGPLKARSLVVATVLPDVDKAVRHASGSDADVIRDRAFFDAARRESVTAKEVARTSMKPGMAVQGPAIIVENETTTIVTSAYAAIGQSDGSLLLRRKGDAA